MRGGLPIDALAQPQPPQPPWARPLQGSPPHLPAEPREALSHALRTKLTIVIGYACVIAKQASTLDADTLDSLVNRLERTAIDLADLADRVMDLRGDPEKLVGTPRALEADAEEEEQAGD